MVKFSGGDSKLRVFSLSYLDTNANMATFFCIPVTCNFVCMCLQDIQGGDKAVVDILTQLYVNAIMHLVRKLHPLLITVDWIMRQYSTRSDLH